MSAGQGCHQPPPLGGGYLNSLGLRHVVTVARKTFKLAGAPEKYCGNVRNKTRDDGGEMWTDHVHLPV
jgi:hypothetical protein